MPKGHTSISFDATEHWGTLLKPSSDLTLLLIWFELELAGDICVCPLKQKHAGQENHPVFSDCC